MKKSGLFRKVHFFYYNRAVIKIQFLTIEGCPNSQTAWKNLQQSLDILQIEIVPERILIHDDLEAEHYSFQGSPSIKVDGIDLWEQKRDEYHMGYRAYFAQEELIGCPTIDMLVERLRVLK